jgi:hypothetical protein
MPGGGDALKYSNPMIWMTSWRIFRPEDHPRASLFPGRKSALGRDPQAERRRLWLVAEIFSPILVRYINSILQDKMLFGRTGPDQPTAGYPISKLEIREEIRPKVMKANAREDFSI